MTTRAAVVVVLIFTACSGGSNGAGGGSATGGSGGSGGSGGAGGTGGSSGVGGGASAGGGNGAGGGTPMFVTGGGNGQAFTPCAQFLPPKFLTVDTVTELALAPGRPGEAFFAWSGLNSGVTAIDAFSASAWQPTFVESDGGQQFVELSAGENGEAHAVLGLIKYYFHAPGAVGFDKPPATNRPTVLPTVSVGGATATYNQPGFPDHLWYQQRSDAGVWFGGTQLFQSDAGTPAGSAYLDPGGNAHVLWSTSFLLNGETRRRVNLTHRLPNGAVTAPTFIAEDKRTLKVAKSTYGPMLIAWVDGTNDTFDVQRVSINGQVTDTHAVSGELIDLAISDDGVARAVWFKQGMGLYVDTQPAPGGTWTSTQVKDISRDGGPANRFDTNVVFGPTGDGYQVDQNGKRFAVASISKTGALGTVKTVDVPWSAGDLKRVAVNRDGHLFILATGQLEADAGFAGVLTALVCE